MRAFQLVCSGYASSSLEVVTAKLASRGPRRRPMNSDEVDEHSTANMEEAPFKTQDINSQPAQQHFISTNHADSNAYRHQNSPPSMAASEKHSSLLPTYPSVRCP